MNIPQGSKSYQKRNPHMFSFNIDDNEPEFTKPPPKRLRQSSKGMNKLEQEWSLNLCVCRDHPPIHRGIAFPLANGLKYTPDFFAFEWPALGELEQPTAWEVKGPYARDDAIAKVKMFASLYKEIRVIMVWKDKATGAWAEQRVLP